MKTIFLVLILPLMAWSANKPISVKNMIVEKQEKFAFEGREGILVKFQGVKKEVFFPLGIENQNPSLVQLLNKAEAEKKAINLKITRADNDLVLYRGKEGSEVLALGADCKKTKTTDNPRLFCNKGYLLESGEIASKE